jgi:hypothetical protein
MEEYVRGTLAFVEVVAAFPLRLVFSHMPMIVSRNSEPVVEGRKMFKGWPGEIWRKMMKKPPGKSCSLRWWQEG